MHTGAEQRAAGDGALGQARLEAKPRPASAKPFNRPAPRLASFRRPTLQALPKTIPVVASASGAAVARSCGFRTVYTLRPGQSLTLLGGRMTVQGTEGALVGPPWSQRELGVVLRENLGAGGAAAQGASLYYEPHADYIPASVSRVAPVDAVVSPPCSQILLGYPLVRPGGGGARAPSRGCWRAVGRAQM